MDYVYDRYYLLLIILVATILRLFFISIFVCLSFHLTINYLYKFEGRKASCFLCRYSTIDTRFLYSIDHFHVVHLVFFYGRPRVIRTFCKKIKYPLHFVSTTNTVNIILSDVFLEWLSSSTSSPSSLFLCLRTVPLLMRRVCILISNCILMSNAKKPTTTNNGNRIRESHANFIKNIKALSIVHR